MKHEIVYLGGSGLPWPLTLQDEYQACHNMDVVQTHSDCSLRGYYDYWQWVTHGEYPYLSCLMAVTFPTK